MNLKQWSNMFHTIGNVNSIIQFAIEIKNVITKHVNVNVKIIVNAKDIIVGILAHLFLRTASIYRVFLMIQNLCVMKLHML